ncbi:PilW family protein [Aneurinibacillus aneurinilyticus]|uniref:Prepilin-type cleavage/methylation protein n=1 Tax=Aneurinibacillus aneurinilyticus ATCC 12856 TaxID=649747 RepID=U1X8M7_ANEAE|nr:prepilin-type N-terminal cleavage/methylation domain-containing protein [Aneurinibacillus aneurinilyticus]ERI11295.1 prepilin-type cleavage/methylation protein [Aneurinibacillus aneurinilyticus ATCC 12856]MED0706624.1 prepilin-type N-terminal cleavage/methylation domain-containing protein [Aneurinibacillus aneurinilyticus]MED0724531.1 prepilin-type N-terminal cleavage/methylation domain-containing protein [Aneurinibacillus aneurinilyticus]MED0731171.1 prepilin-type N-terminal cleavage/methyl
MRNKIGKFLFPLKTERGLTLVELLVAIALFLLIIIPISSYYISGISLYQRTQTETNLRNEADFVLSDIFNTVQNATYFELQPVKNENHKEDLLSIFEKSGTLDFDSKSEEEKNAIKNKLYYGIFTYKLTLDKDNVSKLKRKGLQFFATDAGGKFSYNPSYLVDGLFRLSDDNKKLIVYLLVAPKNSREEENRTDRSGEDMEFKTIEDVKDVINAKGNTSLHYIRLIRTEFAVNNFKGGE